MNLRSVEEVNAIPLLKTLGITLREIGDTYAVMELAVEERHGNYLGGAHGGIIATLIDTACFFPRPVLPSGRTATTANLSVSYLKPAAIGTRLTARAELLHAGRRTASVTVRVSNEDGQLVAHGSATLLFIEETAAETA